MFVLINDIMKKNIQKYVYIKEYQLNERRKVDCAFVP